MDMIVNLCLQSYKIYLFQSVKYNEEKSFRGAQKGKTKRGKDEKIKKSPKIKTFILKTKRVEIVESEKLENLPLQM